MTDDSRQWNWQSEACADKVVIEEQAATAVYMSEAGRLCIRQKRRWDEEEDPIICFSDDGDALYQLMCSIIAEAKLPLRIIQVERKPTGPADPDDPETNGTPT